MISAREDRIGNFVEVSHIGSGTKYRLHQDDVPKLGTPAKVAVYEYDFASYLPPTTQLPSGTYRSRVKFFVAQYLKQGDSKQDPKQAHG